MIAELKFGAISFLFVLAVSGKELSEKPHIIIIIADDVGWNDFSLHGSNQIPTPNIDALGYNGVILDKFYTQQACTPSRAALLTGKYPMRLGLQGTPIFGGENRSLPLDTPTMANRLKDLGYSTHLVGKWHLGAACKEHTPTMRGFDTHFGYWNGYTGYFSYLSNSVNPKTGLNFTGFDLHDGFEPQWALQGQYATELFTKKSLEIIDKHNISSPLFLLFNHLAGHVGENGTELGVPNKTRTNEQYSYIATHERRSFADLINIMDRSVGDVIKKLSDKGMLENSIVVFISDNGAPAVGRFSNFGSGWPFRGMKNTLYEGGLRGTGMIYSPLLKQKNYINKELFHITDFLPTLYRAAGGNLKDLGEIDGIDQWDVISKGNITKRTEILLNVNEKSRYSGILGYQGRYKLVDGTSSFGNNFYGEDGRGPENPQYDFEGIIKTPTNAAIQKQANTKQLDKSLIENLRKSITLSDCKKPSDKIDMKCPGMCLFDINSDPCEVENLINNALVAPIVEDLKTKLNGYIRQAVPQTNQPVDPNSDPGKFNSTWSPWLRCPRSHSFFKNYWFSFEIVY